MSTVAVITDTDSSLSRALADQYRIQLVPITVNFGEEGFTCGVDIDDRALFERIDRSGKLPTTSAPSPRAFSSAYQAAFQNGADSIVCVTVSSRISSTYNAALTACEEFPGKKISVIDSLTLTIGQGFMAIKAAQAALAGAEHDVVVEQANTLAGRVQIYGSLTTLKYLAMSGRVSKLAAGMADILTIRPILTSREGRLEMLEKVRTHRAAMERLVELITTAAGGHPLELAGVTHTNNPQDAARLVETLRTRLDMPEDVPSVEFTPGLSVHTGSGLIGFAFVPRS